MNGQETDKTGLYISGRYLPLLLIVVGMLVYANSLWGTFIYDDGPAIVNNKYIRQLRPLRGLLSTQPQSSVAGRPTVSLSLALNYAVSGYSVWSYHALNLVIHLLAGLTLYGIVRRTLLCERLRQRFGEHAAALAWLSAAVWLVHPIQTESVTYIIQRVESLMGLFYLLTLYAAIRAMQSGRVVLWSVVSVICCGLGMAGKEVMVTAPVLALLYDRAFAAGSFASAFRRRWGLYLGLSATWGILAGLMLSGPRSATAGFSIGISPFDYAASQFGVIVHYIRLCFWPVGLCLDYKWPIAKGWVEIVPPMLVVTVLLAATAWGFVRNCKWSYPAVWFFAVLSPTSSFVPIADLAFEHRMYLPLAGLVVLIVAGGYVSLGYLSKRFFPSRIAAAYKLGGTLVIVIAVVLSWVTVLRNQDYRSAVSIWQTVVAAVPGNSRAHYNLGDALKSQGRLDEAIGQYRQALNADPYYVEVYNNLAAALQSQGRLEQAIGYYRRALEIKPDYADAHNNLAVALQSQGRLDEAVSHYSRALQLNPDLAAAHNSLGNVLVLQGKIDDAVSHYRRAIELSPDDAGVYYNLGTLFQSQGKVNEAISYYRQAIQVSPDYARAHNNMAILLLAQGNPDEAVGHYRRALELMPGNADVHYNLGVALQSQGRLEEAVISYRRALELAPDSADTYYNIGTVLASQGKVEEAVGCYRKALELAVAAGNNDMADNLRKQIELYRKAEP